MNEQNNPIKENAVNREEINKLAGIASKCTHNLTRSMEDLIKENDPDSGNANIDALIELIATFTVFKSTLHKVSTFMALDGTDAEQILDIVYSALQSLSGNACFAGHKISFWDIELQLRKKEFDETMKTVKEMYAVRTAN